MKEPIAFAIASYNRLNNQRFLHYLRSLGYGEGDIYISTQTQKDFAEYKERYGGLATILYREGRNVCDNKNTLLDAIRGRRVIVASDKVEAVCKLEGAKAVPIKTREELESVIDRCYAIAGAAGADVFGVYPTGNPFFMSHTANVNQLLLGCFMGFKADTPLRFNPDTPLKEDFEIALRVIGSGRRVVRFNNLCLKATFHQKGGSHELWNSEGDHINRECCEYLLMRYPDLVEPHRTRANELRYIGWTKKINL